MLNIERSMPSSSLSWVKQIPRSLFHFDNVPLVGQVPSMPMKEWTEMLKASLGFKSLEIKTNILNWTEGKDFFEGIPNKKVFGFGIPGITGVFFFAIPSNALSDLAAHLLTVDEKSAKEIDSSLQEGFIQFLINEALFTLQKSGQPEKIMPVHLESLPTLPKDAGLVMDVQVIKDEKVIPCRLIFTHEFQTSLAAEFKPNLQDLYLNSPLSEKIDLTVSFEISRFKIKLKEFKSVKPGDFIVLDRCSIDPKTLAGPLLLKVFNLPFFAGQLNDGKITLAEQAQYYEAEAHMQSENPEKDEPEDFDLKEFEEDLQEFSDEELEELDHEKEEIAHKPDAKEEALEEEPTAVVTVSSVEEPTKNIETVNTAAEETVSQTPKTVKELLAAGDVPLSISVEIGRVNIPLNKLIGLTPGNILEINSPVEGVDLVLNGKKVAQGELLKIGDVLGVRITDIGH